jgi:hypothetical protein
MMYVDPGTGSFIAQAVIAGVLGFLFVIRKWLRDMWRKIRGVKEETDEE